MGDPILCILKLVLKVSPQPIPDTFYKDARIAAIFTKEGFEFFPGYNIIRLFLLNMPAFVLCLASSNTNLNKRGRKRSAIFFVGSSYIEIVFALWQNR